MSNWYLSIFGCVLFYIFIDCTGYAYLFISDTFVIFLWTVEMVNGHVNIHVNDNMMTIVTEGGIKGRDKFLHPADTVGCNYLSLPLLHGLSTTLLLCVKMFFYKQFPYVPYPTYWALKLSGISRLSLVTYIILFNCLYRSSSYILKQKLIPMLYISNFWTVIFRYFTTFPRIFKNWSVNIFTYLNCSAKVKAWYCAFSQGKHWLIFVWSRQTHSDTQCS